MKKIAIIAVSLLTSVINLFADYSDYGRDYSMRKENTDTPLWFVIIVIISIWILYKLIYTGISKLDNKRKYINEITSRTQEYISKKEQNHECPNCNGSGFVKVGPVYSDGEICKYCYGYGKELNDNALKYYEDIKAEQRWRREERQNITDKSLKGALCFLDSHFPCKSSHLFEEELKKCNICTNCNGKGQIKYDTFYELDERSNIVKYRRLLCPQCNGAGRILI